jgi:NAD-dependent DNA ligase
MKIQNFKQFSEAIYATNWKEEYEKIYCPIFDLNVNDEFEMKIDSKPKYLDEDVSTIRAYYSGRHNDIIYFTYDIDGIVYKIPKEELERKFIRKI